MGVWPAGVACPGRLGCRADGGRLEGTPPTGCRTAVRSPKSNRLRGQAVRSTGAYFSKQL